jgi:hypothetical protein
VRSARFHLAAAVTSVRRGEGISGLNIKESFWLRDPALLGETVEQWVALAPERGEVRQIGTSFSGRPIHAVRFGSGPQRIVFVNALHGWEVVTTNAAVAFLWSLFSGKGLDGEDLSELAARVAERQTVWMLPLCSPDIAARQYERFPEGFFPNAIGMKTEADWLQYAHVMNDPYERYTGRLIAGRFHGFTREQVEEWLKDNRWLGQRWSDQGLDVWVDFKDFDSPEARAVRDFVLEVQPDCVMEYHGHEDATFVTAPTPNASRAKAVRQVEFALRMLQALIRTGIKCAVQPVNVYLTPDSPTFVNWVDATFPRAMVLFAELQMYQNEFAERRMIHPAFQPARGRPMLTQEEIIRSGWALSMALVEMGNGRPYRISG